MPACGKTDLHQSRSMSNTNVADIPDEYLTIKGSAKYQTSPRWDHPSERGAPSKSSSFQALLSYLTLPENRAPTPPACPRTRTLKVMLTDKHSTATLATSTTTRVTANWVIAEIQHLSVVSAGSQISKVIYFSYSHDIFSIFSMQPMSNRLHSVTPLALMPGARLVLDMPGPALARAATNHEPDPVLNRIPQIPEVLLKPLTDEHHTQLHAKALHKILSREEWMFKITSTQSPEPNVPKCSGTLLLPCHSIVTKQPLRFWPPNERRRLPIQWSQETTTT